MDIFITAQEGKQPPKCPSCGSMGRAVKTTTLRSLIKKERQGRITDSQYFFCNSRDCNVVYFSEDGIQPFYKEDLTVRVGIKEDSPPRPLCYCFNHSMEEIYHEIKRTGKTTVVEHIKSRMKEEGCSCETRNPQGSCCLSTVNHFVNEVLLELGIKEDQIVDKGHKDCCKVK